MFLSSALSYLHVASSESPSCPCITAPTWQTDLGRTEDEEPCVLMGNGNCFPENFGVGSCKAWEGIHDPACTSTAGTLDYPAYCDEPWCYVDTEICEQRQTGKSYRLTDWLFVPTTNEGRRPHYSYETCGGDTEAWTQSIVEQSLAGRTLRAGVPKSFFPEAFMMDGSGSPLPDGPITRGSDMSGVWVDYYEEMAALGNFELEYYPVSNSSLQDHGSAWTACVQDVAAGVLDLCVANVWVTPERIELGAAFVTPATSDRFKLLTLVTTDVPTVWERLWTPFAPFTSALWMSIVATWFLVGFMYAMFGSASDFSKDLNIFHEFEEKKEKMKREKAMNARPSEGEKRGSISQAFSAQIDLLKVQVEYAKKSKASWFSTAKLRKLGKLTYFATMEMAGASVAYEGNDGIAKKLSLRIIKLGYAFFIIVTVSCYVGNMSAMRTAEVGVSAINSVADCASDPLCKMCIHTITSTYFSSAHPSLNTHVSSSSKGLLLDLLDGKCTVSMSQGLHFGALGEDAKVIDLCDYSYDKEAYNVYVSQPAAPDIAQAISRLSTRMREVRFYDGLYEKYFTSYEDLCMNDGHVATSSEAMDEAFDLPDFAGLYTIVVFIFAVGIVTDIYEHSKGKASWEKATRKRHVWTKRESSSRLERSRQSPSESDDDSSDGM